MVNVFLFTQNLVLESLKRYQGLASKTDTNVFLTTHFLFENERGYIKTLFNNCVFRTFADYLSDGEMEKCDIQSYTHDGIKYNDYLLNIKKNKNLLVAQKIISEFPNSKKYVLSDDLGIYLGVWRKKHFRYLRGTYYYKESKKTKTIRFFSRIGIIKKLYHILTIPHKTVNPLRPEEVQVSSYNGRRVVFIGKMSRIDYRLSITFHQSEEELNKVNKGVFDSKEKTLYMTTWHEHGKCIIPDDDRYEVRWAQDGYLPPNYSHKDYYFKPNNVKYYCWDFLGTKLFKNQGLPYELIPFRKKLYLPFPVFPKEVKNVLVVASGSGDWTALKNRSDDDIMVVAFAQMARRFPTIHFTFRCHPTWVHPLNVGVNSVNRVNDYFSWLNLPNLSLSSNMPLANVDGKFQLSFSRCTLDEDLKKADIVFGEHSISMIDAGFKKLPFCSVNLTKRRNFFVGINDLGFPTVSSHEGIASVIESVVTKEYQNKYLIAVQNYNNMTDEDV